MKRYPACKAASIVAAITLWQSTGTAALTTNTIFEQNFDSDTVGQLPSGWDGLPTVNNNAFVTNNVSVSSPNSLAIQITDSTLWNVGTPFPAHDLSNGDPDNRLSYSIDINVDHIDANDSEGINFRIWTGISQIDIGTPRILRNGGNWRFLSSSNQYVGNFNTNQWYNFRVVISPTSPSSGTANYYMDGSPIHTETYSGRDPSSQTSNLDRFDLRYLNSDVNAGTGALMYFDNLLIQAIIPEPSSVVLLALGGLALWRRRA